MTWFLPDGWKHTWVERVQVAVMILTGLALVVALVLLAREALGFYELFSRHGGVWRP